MKGALDRTKVVLRHLPPSISQETLLEQIDGSFAGRYNFLSFHSGKISQKGQCFSRAYINFNNPEDVVDFSEFFGGHVFVNEKGSQFKVIVEYSPSQRIPKQCSKIDGREGTIFKDLEYLEFLEIIAKPVEHLPSAEIQLDRRESERAGGVGKDAVIVTPLMDFVRQKRATKSGFRRSLPNGKVSRRSSGASANVSGSTSTKRGSEKKKISNTVYVQRDSGKATGGKDKSAPFNKQNVIPICGKVQSEMLEEESGTVAPDYLKKKVLLLKGKERNISHVPIPDNHHLSSKNSFNSPTVKQIQRNEGSGKAIRKILKHKDAHLVQPVSLLQAEHHINPSFEKDKRPPRPPNNQLNMKDKSFNDDKTIGIDKQERYARSKDSAFESFCYSDGMHANDEFLSQTSMQTQLDVLEGSHGDFPSIKIAKASSGGRNAPSDNGSHKNAGRRTPTYNLKDVDGFPHVCESKSFKRGACSYGSHEKQVWVQKPSPGS